MALEDDHRCANLKSEVRELRAQMNVLTDESVDPFTIRLTVGYESRLDGFGDPPSAHLFAGAWLLVGCSFCCR